MDDALHYLNLIREIRQMDRRLLELRDEVCGEHMYVKPNGTVLFETCDSPTYEILDDLHRKLGEAVMARPDVLAAIAYLCMCDGGGSVAHTPSASCTSGPYVNAMIEAEGSSDA